jgi:hypothetical protein
MRASDSKTCGTGTILLGLAAIGLAGMVGTISLIHQVGELGVKVGDFVVFDPREPMSSDMNARVVATYATETPGATCVLDVRTMHANGGSLIIESRQPQPQGAPRLLAHWAGPRSGDGVSDCGRSADLLIRQDDIETLAMSAGGYGISADKLSHVSLAAPAVETR